MTKERTFALGCVVALGVSCGAADAATFKVLHRFEGGSSDGAEPYAGLVSVGGLLFGTTAYGGPNGFGTVFSVDPVTGAEKVVHTFSGASDGAFPMASLIAVGTTLYGTTESDGHGNPPYGTVFALDTTTGIEKVLHGFGLNDGNNPVAPVIDIGGILYGTTTGGPRYGTVFSVNPATGVETLLHKFNNYRYGDQPYAGLTAVGNRLYGTTYFGGAIPNGDVFAVKQSTGGEVFLYSFAGGSDGAEPSAGLTKVGDVLYGTTTAGGVANGGTVFSISLKSGAESVIYRFQGGSDGARPEAGLVVAGANLLGTTYSGGSAFRGTVFSLTPATGAKTVLHTFTGADGANPVAGLVHVGHKYYGTTQFGGDKDCYVKQGGCGVVFEITAE